MAVMSKKVFFYMSSDFHYMYHHMADNPPEGFEYSASKFMAHKEITNSVRGMSPTLGNNLMGILKSLQPKLSPVYNDLLISLNKPKVREFDATGYDLVHSAQSLLSTNRPYVADFEHAAVFCGFNQYALERESYVRALKKVLLDKNLKRLIPWTNAIKESLLNFVKDEGIEEKTEVIMAPITPPEKFERQKHPGVNFLFIGRWFYEKGGLETLIAFDRISEKYDCSLTMVAPSAPEDVKERFSKNKKIRFLGTQPYNELKRLYGESDVLVFPTHLDTVGFVIPEAFSYGLPVITVDSFSLPELIKDEKTGLIVKSYYSSFRKDRGYIYPTARELWRRRPEDCKNPTERYIGELGRAMEKTLNDGALMRRMSKAAQKEAVDGMFSLAKWKKKMGGVYEEALSS